MTFGSIAELAAEIEGLEPARHLAEVKMVANMDTNAKRAVYIEDVRTKRGKDAAEKLRRDTWRHMNAEPLEGGNSTDEGKSP